MAAATTNENLEERCCDVNMQEVGRPPGDPPDNPISWVDKVTRCKAGGIPVPEKVMADEFVTSRMNLEFPNGEDGEAVITIGQEVLDVMNGLWKQCMIVKVFGRNITLAALNHKLRELWKPKSGMYVLDLPRQYFLVRFDGDDEYMAALTGGPWKVFGSYLSVKAWSPEFDPLSDDIVTTPVWVRLTNIPVNYYHRAIQMKIAEGVANPIKVDLTTLKLERARFARICGEVNLKKPLKGTVVVNGERYFVAYEGLTNICAVCGIDKRDFTLVQSNALL